MQGVTSGKSYSAGEAETAFSFFHVQSGCNNGALWVGTQDPWQAGCKELEASCSQESERPGTQAHREAPGLCGRRPGSGTRSLRTRSWARRRLTITPLEAQAQTPAKVGTSAGNTCPRRGVAQKSPASFIIPSAHSNVSKFREDSVYSHAKILATFSLNNTSTHGG